MSLTEPSAEGIRGALTNAAAALRAVSATYHDHPEQRSIVGSAVIVEHIRDVLLANPDRVRALLDLTADDLNAAVHWYRQLKDDAESRVNAAYNRHPSILRRVLKKEDSK